MQKLERIQRILAHPVYNRLLAEIQELERERIYCGHGRGHLLDVARIGQMLNLEEGAGIPKETLYAAALLHDIGRGRQYLDGTPHEIAGEALAGPILADCGFPEEERAPILAAIRRHRVHSRHTPLADILYRADKRSRDCFWCGVRESCKWEPDKKNTTLEY